MHLTLSGILFRYVWREHVTKPESAASSSIVLSRTPRTMLRGWIACEGTNTTSKVNVGHSTHSHSHSPALHLLRSGVFVAQDLCPSTLQARFWSIAVQQFFGFPLLPSLPSDISWCSQLWRSPCVDVRRIVIRDMQLSGGALFLASATLVPTIPMRPTYSLGKTNLLRAS